MCLKPNLVRSRIDPGTGAITTVFLGSAGVVDPRSFGEPYVDHEWYSTVPCGHCRECKMDYAKQWANRMILESEDWPCNLFLTTTYRNEDLPINAASGFPTLSKLDVQLFMKRLRKYFAPRRIRFYFAGEYGTRTHRPHYHAIIFNLGLKDFPDIRIHSYNELKQPLYYSPTLEKIWSHGFILMGDVTWKTCNYVARYVTKKQKASELDLIPNPDFDPEDVDSEPYVLPYQPEFSLCSRRPGIGLRKAEELLSTGCSVFNVSDADTPFDFSIPSSCLKIFREKGLDRSLELSYNKAKLSRERLLSAMNSSQLSYVEILQRREKDLIRKLNILPERL